MRNFSSLLFFCSFALFFDNNNSAIPSTQLAGPAKVFDDPYLSSEKTDTDAVEVYDSPNLPKMPKTNPYKPMKGQKVENPNKYWEKSREERGKDLFEEMATFNYGVIGMLKKQREKMMESIEANDKRQKWHFGDRRAKAEPNTWGEDRRSTEEEDKEEPDQDTVGWFE